MPASVALHQARLEAGSGQALLNCPVSHCPTWPKVESRLQRQPRLDAATEAPLLADLRDFKDLGVDINGSLKEYPEAPGCSTAVQQQPVV